MLARTDIFIRRRLPATLRVFGRARRLLVGDVFARIGASDAASRHDLARD
jgi:hypothetical protein